MNGNGKSSMPGVIVIVAMVQFCLGGAYLLYKAFNPTPGAMIDNAKALSLVDMYVIASIGFLSGATGYWLGKNNTELEEKRMLLNSGPLPPQPAEPPKG